MSYSAERLFTTYFGELERRGIPYVVLHSYEHFPDYIRSDVDYAVRPVDLARVYPVLGEVAGRAGWRIVQTLRYEVDAYYSVLMDAMDAERFIKLDRTSHFTDNGCLLVPVAWMLDGRRKYNGFYVPRPSSEFIYTLAKAFSKKKSLAEYLPRLRELWRAEPERSQELFEGLLGGEVGDLRRWFGRPAPEWQALSDVMHRRNRYSLMHRMREWRRRAGRVLRPSGLRLAFLGPDGAGKSATISRVQTLLASCFRRQQVFHCRPMMFQRSGGGPVTQPHALPPRSIIASWVKVLWFFCDHWLGWFFQQVPGQCRSTCIIFDRNFDDLVIDPKRYRLDGAQALVRLLRPFVPRPHLTFVLEAPARVIHRRKPELSVEEVEEQCTALRELAARDPRYIVVSTECSPDEVARVVCSHVIKLLAARERSRCAVGP